ncbi:MAG: YkgJ family cysteine cluster protein [Planctomycetota bacterium]|jgi:Fe-S-cluster containining protein
MTREKWYHSGLKFTCTQCGDCCTGAPGYVWANKEEIRKIAKFLERTDDWLDKQHLRRVGLRYSLTERPNGDCIFLRRENGRFHCSIYAVRPLQCRTWPFWAGNLRSPQTWDQTKKVCPGVDSGKHHELTQIETLRTRKTW